MIRVLAQGYQHVVIERQPVVDSLGLVHTGSANDAWGHLRLVEYLHSMGLEPLHLPNISADMFVCKKLIPGSWL